MAQADSINVDHVLDLEGVRCPDFIEAVRNFIRTKCESGQVVYIQADEPSSARDIDRLCTFLDHELVHQDMSNPVYTFVVRKG